MTDTTTSATRRSRGIVSAAALAVVAGLAGFGISNGLESDALAQSTRPAQQQGAQGRQVQMGGEEAQAMSEGELTINKTARGNEVKVGQIAEYQIEVSNDSGGDLNNVVLREELPQGMRFESADPEPTSVEGQTLVWRIGNIADGQGLTATVRAIPQQTGDLQACTSYEFERGVCLPLTVVNPELAITKSGPQMASVCTPIEYTYTVTNEGDTAAEGVVLIDDLNEGLRRADDGGAGDGDVEIDIGTVEPGQTVERVVRVKADRPLTLDTAARATSNLDEVRSQVVETEFMAPDVQLNVNAAQPYTVLGEPARFEVRVTNPGDVPADMVVLATAASGGEIQRIYGARGEEGQVMQGGMDPADGDAVIGTLQPGDSRTLFVDVVGNEGGVIKLGAVSVAQCRDSGTELARAEGTAQVEVRAFAALQVEVVDSQDPVRVGESTSYEITIRNEGRADDNNLGITAELPDGLEYVAENSGGPTEITVNGKELSFGEVQTLPQGESVTWYVTGRATESTGGQKFKVFVKSDSTGDETVQEDEPTRLFGNAQGN